MAGIYLHIPFCKQACHYCDFHFSTNTEIKGELIRAMADEIHMRRDYLAGELLHTIYFGGGTPSMMDGEELELLLQAVRQTHTVAPGAEITVEANPDDLTGQKLNELKASGVNRLSVGIQSFDDDILRYLNRVHDSATAAGSIELARQAGFENITIDLIYAIPGLTEEAWEKNIKQALRLHPEHISAYSLTIEEKTAFGNWLAKGKMETVDEAAAAVQLETLMEQLSKAGYKQYEISNFAKPGFESRHNSNYWTGEKYLGVGPGAHSYDQKTRQHNVSNNHLYVRSVKDGKIPAEAEELRRVDHINEYILTTLRTANGCDLEALKRNFNHDLLVLHGGYLHELENHHLVFLDGRYLKLTETGRLLADRISSDLFLIE